MFEKFKYFTFKYCTVVVYNSLQQLFSNNIRVSLLETSEIKNTSKN